MRLLILLIALGGLGLGLWFLASLVLMLRDYDEIDLGDDDF